MDKFHEQLLRTSKSVKYKLCSAMVVISTILAILTFLSSVVIMKLGVIIVTVIFVALFFVFRHLRDKQYKEYEYIFTNGNLQIDIIYNKKKRKTLYDVDIKNLEDFGKDADIKVDNSYKKVICIPWDNEAERYVLLLSEKGKQAVYIAPNDELLKMIKIFNVRRPKFN